LREAPRRFYELSGDVPLQVGVKGELAPELLMRDGNLLEEVNKWMARLGFGGWLECHGLDPSHDVFQLTYRWDGASPETNFADTGFGISQLLPLITQLVALRRNRILISEQPEIHLNPAAQAVVADLLTEVVRRRARVIVETHSEHLLLRLRYLVAENKLDATDFAIYYVERSPGSSVSHIRRVEIQENGHIEPKNWPKGFFAESFRESMALASSQARRAHDAK
jgi:predicted ATPase